MEYWYERYELFHGATRVGIITGTGGACGFPTFWAGAIEYDAGLWAASEVRHLAEYLVVARQAAELVATGGDTSGLYARVRAEFMDLVDSPDWRLVDSRDEVIPIHCPMHNQGDVLTWVRVDNKSWC